MSDAGFGRLLGQIYDAALDADLWPGVIAEMAELAGAKSHFRHPTAGAAPEDPNPGAQGPGARDD
ncbi:MAG: hypothetical protein WD341_16370 [Tistlia sp.]|uniref:hypothetical protein n=1 Tax=Tistlia sp. TaxID=3057121 RepID=UPI0034A41A70